MVNSYTMYICLQVMMQNAGICCDKSFHNYIDVLKPTYMYTVAVVRYLLIGILEVHTLCTSDNM